MLPEVYSSESRDFQILTRVLDYVQNSVKFDIDTIKSINSTEDIPAVYLERLKSKLGFFTTKMFPDEQLRFILEVFPYILRYKGSITGIKRCVYSYLKIINSTSGALIDIDRENHCISVGLPGTEIDFKLLEEMLKYVLPVGFYLDLYDASTLSDSSYSEFYENKDTVRKSELSQGVIDNSIIIKDAMKNTVYAVESVMNTVNIGTVINNGTESRLTSTR
jgi:hypothetical protein